MYDLVIRGATVVDGLGHDPVRADVAVKDGRIAAVGADRVMPEPVDHHRTADHQIVHASLSSTNAVMASAAMQSPAG